MSRTAKHNEIIADLFHQGYTLQMIADRAGISKPGVQKAVNRLNLHRTRSDAHKKKNQLLVNLEAENAHLREKLAADDIDEFMDEGQPEAVASFALAMKKKLYQKSLEGYHGWDEPVYAELLKEKLYEHIKREEANDGQLVDIANLAMMLWNLEQKAIIDGNDHSEDGRIE